MSRLMQTRPTGSPFSSSQGIFEVSLGVRKPNMINLTAPASLSFFPQSIGVKQFSTLEFDLQKRWILGAGTYNVTLGAVSDNGIQYGCNMALRSSGVTQVEITNASLRFDDNRTASVDFTIRNKSDGLFTGGAVCYVGQQDCSSGGDSTVRFSPVPLKAAISVKAG